MAADTIYSVVYITANDALLTEHGSATMRRSGDGQIVKTVAKGFAGISPGAPMAEYDVTNALPNAGLEIDMGDRISSYTPLEMGLQAGGKIYVSKGYVMEDTIQGAVDSPSGYSFRFVGTFPKAV